MLRRIWHADSSAGAAPGQTLPDTIHPWSRSPSMKAERSKRAARRRPTVVLPAPGMPLSTQTSAIRRIVAEPSRAGPTGPTLPGNRVSPVSDPLSRALGQVEAERLELDRKIHVLEAHVLGDLDAARGEVQ